MAATQDLTTEEYALYDRQVRLWGAQAQQTIAQAHILIISLRALGSEVAKNLTLAGVASLTIIDDALVEEEDLGAGYFLCDTDIGQPRAASAIPRIQVLNPRVKVQVGPSLLEITNNNPALLARYTLIVACDLDFPTMTLINAAARLAERPFYATGVHGEYGFIFADLIDHTFTIERAASNKSTVPDTQETVTRKVIHAVVKSERDQKVPKETITKREIYCPLLLANSSPLDQSILANTRKLRNVPALLPALRALFDFQRQNAHLPHTALDLATFTISARSHAEQLLLPEPLTADFLRAFIQSLGAELTPTASFVGSRLSEDIINAVTHREQPIQNFALFDGESGPIYCLYSPPPELVTLAAPVHNGTL